MLHPETLNQTLSSALPQSFDFYHLGKIAGSAAIETGNVKLSLLEENRAALAYSLKGDLQATVVLLLEPGLDLSMYSEAGNIIASQLATRLANEHGIDVVLSPPSRLQKAQLEYLAQVSTDISKKTYVHAHAGKDVQLETLIFTHGANRTLTDGSTS